ncbi:MAG: hypothetical protein LBQ35_03510 [Spirochaetaceae bacterium]|nr:hypothetical protein [Spirochaetaceae bacterium]
MKTEKRALIVSDGTGPAAALAENIVAALAGLYHTRLVRAAEFSATDLLPAEVCFFGCTAPNPPSFAHFAEVLGHINLAGRRCGLFAPGSGETAGYLEALVRDSEIVVHPGIMTEPAPGREELRAWVQDVCGEVYHDKTIRS